MLLFFSPKLGTGHVSCASALLPRTTNAISSIVSLCALVMEAWMWQVTYAVKLSTCPSEVPSSSRPLPQLNRTSMNLAGERPNHHICLLTEPLSAGAWARSVAWTLTRTIIAIDYYMPVETPHLLGLSWAVLGDFWPPKWRPGGPKELPRRLPHQGAAWGKRGLGILGLS